MTQAMHERKALGAFYTGGEIASFLVGWALRRPRRAVMDPSCGDGRFLALAKGAGAARLVGCDVSPAAIAESREALAGHGAELIAADFFALDPGAVEPVDAVVGNPPFIRYQRFTGESRRQALSSALRLGVRLTQLTSSWAPFLLHAVQFLRPGGDLAMVVPAEILRTQYGLVTLRALLRRFARITVLAFEENLFADAQEETCLLLAEELGGSCDSVRLVPMTSATDLATWSRTDLTPGASIDVPFAEGAVVRFAEAFLPAPERRAWRKASGNAEVRPVAAVGKVTNGYVSGDNAFFHRTAEEAEAAGLPATWLFPVARNARSLAGLAFTRADVAALERRASAHHLVVPQEDLFSGDPAALRRFAREGERRGTTARFKCRTREPWWQVPGLVKADVLVTYMSGHRPRAAVDRAGAYYSNSLHGLQLREPVAPELVALAFHSSLTLLSLEIEGRSYGGGMLKLEPRELDRVLLPLPAVAPDEVARAVARVDPLLRAGRYDDAVAEVDRWLLGEKLGLPKAILESLAAARRRLVARRTDRARPGAR